MRLNLPASLEANLYEKVTYRELIPTGFGQIQTGLFNV